MKQSVQHMVLHRSQENVNNSYLFARDISKRSWVLLAWLVLNEFSFLPTSRASLVAQKVKKSACNARDLSLIPGLGRSPREENGNPLSNFAWRNPWTEDPGRLQSLGSQRSQHNWATNTTKTTSTHEHCFRQILLPKEQSFFSLCVCVCVCV